MKAFKGFDKNLKCRDFQYEIGKEYKIEGKPIRCTEHGFHACENPLDVLKYYPLVGSRFCETESGGEIDTSADDSKIASSKIKIGMELNLKTLAEAAVKFVFEKTKISKKTSATSGEYAHSATSGNGANSATSGEYASSSVGHKNAVAAAVGINAKVKGAMGSWIVAAEWIRDENFNWLIKKVVSAQIDGKKIKPDVFYCLKNGKFVEAK